jgi:ectoine hydroxylase-related dioxygenase (phytanoyl-CoA dioxygenase family)
MDPACLEYCLTDPERDEFEQNGFFIVEDVLPPRLIEALSAVVDRLDAEYRPQMGLGPYERLNLLDFVGKDEIFLELLDWPKTFPKVWGLLGWNLQLYHSHMTVTPVVPPEERPAKNRLGWHQDSGRLNQEMETEPRPRISLKVAFFLTDTREVGRGNFYVIPGSHRQNRVEYPADGISDPAGATPVCVGPGDAVFFDRRLWHSASENFANVPRKVLFYGYSYRWLRPRDDMTGARWIDRCDPIRAQLLGASASGGHGYTSPREEDVPLKGWIREHLGAEAVAP